MQLDEVMVTSYQYIENVHRNEVLPDLHILEIPCQTQEQHLRIDKDSLVPTEFTGIQSNDLRIEEASQHGSQRDSKGDV